MFNYVNKKDKNKNKLNALKSKNKTITNTKELLRTCKKFFKNMFKKKK